MQNKIYIYKEKKTIHIQYQANINLVFVKKKKKRDKKKKVNRNDKFEKNKKCNDTIKKILWSIVYIWLISIATLDKRYACSFYFLATTSSATNKKRQQKNKKTVYCIELYTHKKTKKKVCNVLIVCTGRLQ